MDRDRILHMELPGRIERGRSQRRLMDVVEGDMKRGGATDEDNRDGARSRQKIRYGDP